MEKSVAAALVAMALFTAAEAAEPPPNYQTRTTDNGCIFYDWVNPINGFTGEPGTDTFSGAQWSWDKPCEKGQPISGQGTISYTLPPGGRTLSGSSSGTLVGGYRDGPWPYKMNRADGQVFASEEPPTYRMGCQIISSGPRAGEIFYDRCTPGTVEEKVAAAPPPGDDKAAPGSAGSGEEDGGADGAAGENGSSGEGASEPGGPDHVTEISEGGRETDRFIAARVSRERAPKHHPEHDRSECLGKYLEEHVPPHNHYVLYNKCDAPINVVWCVMGTGSSCEAGSGQIANMNPRIGYVAGMEDSPGMKAGACSGKVWPIMENGQMAGYGCE